MEKNGLYIALILVIFGYWFWLLFYKTSFPSRPRYTLMPIDHFILNVLRYAIYSDALPYERCRKINFEKPILEGLLQQDPDLYQDLESFYNAHHYLPRYLWVQVPFDKQLFYGNILTCMAHYLNELRFLGIQSIDLRPSDLQRFFPDEHFGTVNLKVETFFLPSLKKARFLSFLVGNKITLGVIYAGSTTAKLNGFFLIK